MFYKKEVNIMTAKEQIKTMNKYCSRKEPIPQNKIVESKKKYNRKKFKKYRLEERVDNYDLEAY